MSAAFDRILNTVQMRLTGVVYDAIKYELFPVADELLRESGLWTDDVSFNTTAGKTDYRIVVPAGQTLRLQGVKDANGHDVWGTLEMPHVLNLRDAPQDTEKYCATVVLSVVDPVKRDAFPLMPEWIVQKYNGVLTDGVLGHLMSQSSKPYSDENKAVYHLKRFRNGVAQARRDALTGHTENNQAWSYPQQFAVRRK